MLRLVTLLRSTSRLVTLLIPCDYRGFYFVDHLNIRLKPHPVPGTIEIFRCLALVALELGNKLQILQAQKSQPLQFLSLPIYLSPQTNNQRLRSLSPSRMPFALLNLTALDATPQESD